MRKKTKSTFSQDGFLIVNKPKDMTSSDVVLALRRRFKLGKIGHAGTLDPFATGVLVLAFNRAARLMRIVSIGDKTYRGIVKLGEISDTGDLTGKVVKRKSVKRLCYKKVKKVIRSFKGKMIQYPPMYSAVKYRGIPLYKYARFGLKVERGIRFIFIYSMSLKGIYSGNIDFEIVCSKGTYVRRIAEDLARKLGNVGCLTSLERLGSAPFSLEESSDFKMVLEFGYGELKSRLINMVEVLKRCGVFAINVSSKLALKLKNGYSLGFEEISDFGLELRPGLLFQILDQNQQLVAVFEWLGRFEGKGNRSYRNIYTFVG